MGDINQKSMVFSEIYLEDTICKENEFVIFVGKNGENDFAVDKENSKVIVDGKSLAITDIQTLKESTEPVTYLCMVDVSGSMKEEWIISIKEALKQLVSEKREQDIIEIAKLGNELTQSGLMTNTEEIVNFIDGIQLTSEDTNLYYGICKEMDYIKKESLSQGKKCFLIFSDGADDQAQGITRGEAEDVIKNSDIPIFTVAMMPDEPTEAQLESAKILGSFARYSNGGEHYTSGTEEVFTVIKEITESINNSLVIKTEVPVLESKKDTVPLEVTISNGKISVTEQKNITAENMPLQVLEAETEQITTEEATVLPEKNNNNGYILIGAGIVFFAGILIFTMKRKTGNFKVTKEDRKLEVILSRLGDEGITYQVKMRDGIKIGRNSKCQLCIKEDAMLSELHCVIVAKNGEMFVRDEDSTNGTYVNGVHIVGEIKLEQDDILLMGSYEYKITWK